MKNTKLIGKLLGNVCRAHARRADQMLEKDGMYRGQAFFMILLAHEDGLTHSEIAEKLEVSPAAVTKVIKRLEQLEYIERRADAYDERVSRVYMLDKGTDKIHEIFQTLKELNRIMLTGFSAEEEELFNEFLLRAQKNLQQIDDENK